jgi:hypothetical protein
MKIDFDVDIDMADRNTILDIIQHTPASVLKDGLYTKHNTGVYLQHIPSMPLEGYSSVDHKQAEQDGWFKVDFLNNSIYTDIKDEAHLIRLQEKKPIWELLQHEEVVEQLYHINKYTELLREYKPGSVEQLAMILAIIRPGKRHLVGKSWADIALTVWEPPTDGTYYFKKSHAIAFAVAIVVQLNLICEKLVGFAD